MKRSVIIGVLVLVAYLLSFFLLMFLLSCGMTLPTWLTTVAEIVYAPILFLLDRIFGGIC